MMCFEWMSHGDIDLPLRMVALQRPGVNRRGGGMGDGRAQPETEQDGGGSDRGAPAIPTGALPLDSSGRGGLMAYVPGSWEVLGL